MKNLYKVHLSKVLSSFDEMLEELNYDYLLIYSGEVKTVFNDDNTYAFKANFNFKYIAPIENYPNSMFIYKSGDIPRLILFQKEDYWDSQPKDIEGFFTNFFQIEYYNNLDKIYDFLPKDLSQAAFLGEDTRRFENLDIKSFNNKKVVDYIHYARTIKSDYEIECIKKANELASYAHEASKKAFLEGKSELETHLEYLNAIAFKESEVPYSNIVAFNQNSAILHYVDYERKRHDTKSFLLDAGATYNGYCSDITRTFVKDGHEEFKELIKAIDNSCLNIISKIELDLNYEQLQEQMHKDLSKILVDFKLMNIHEDEIYETNLSKIFSPAGVGHYLGLQVHDVGNFIRDKKGTAIERSKEHLFLRLRKDIQDRNVFTIEPGIYFIEQLLRPYFEDKRFNWKNINRLKPYGGVRIEDNIAIKDAKVLNLTREYFKRIDTN